MTATKSTAPRAAAEPVRPMRQAGQFTLHFAEMCAPMCIGFAVGDLVYFWLADLAGYSEPFRDLPYLSVLVITVSMTAPMTAWMVFRGMPHRAIAEMTIVMPVVAAVLVALGLAGAVATANLAFLEHALMMPAMLIPMFLRLDLYTARGGHAMPSRPATSGPVQRMLGRARIRGRRGSMRAAWRAGRIMRSSRSKLAR